MSAVGKETVRVGAIAVLRLFARLGLVGFGGPTAHVALFHSEVVRRLGWIDEHAFSELLAVSQSLPGPSSSQLAAAIGWRVAGLVGGFAAVLAFAAPSLIVMLALALGLTASAATIPAGVIVGLAAAVAGIVASALVSMTRALAWSPGRGAIALAALGLTGLGAWSGAPMALLQLGVLGLAAIVGIVGLPPTPALADPPRDPTRRASLAALAGLAVAAALLVASLFVPPAAPDWLDAASESYRAGALVFGGGHVVLPLLEAGFAPELVSNERFLAGYGAAQALPGPVFTVAGYLGAQAGASAGASPGAMIAAGLLSASAIFLPGLLILFSLLGVWPVVSAYTRVRSALAGVNAAVVGLLGAAFIDPVLTSAAQPPEALAIAAGVFMLVRWGRLPAPLAVMGAAAAGGAIATWR